MVLSLWVMIIYFYSLVALKLNIDVVYNKEARTSQSFRYIILD